jgi:hypothetical protein
VLHVFSSIVFTSANKNLPPRDGKGFKGFLPQLDEFYFTTAKKKILPPCSVPCLAKVTQAKIDEKKKDNKGHDGHQ